MKEINNCKFITLGESMVMFVAMQPGKLSEVEQFSRHIAGAESNVAIGMARRGFDTTYITKVGNDCLGEFICSALKQEHINMDCVLRSDTHPTGFQLKSNEVDGRDPRVQYFRKNSAASTLCPANFASRVFAEPAHLHLTGVAAAVSPSLRELCHHALKEARKRDCSISFDTNLRPSLWSSEAQMIEEINALAFKSDIVLPGIAEGKILVGSDQPEVIADFYLNQGVKSVFVKLGGDGAYYKSAQGEEGIAAPFAVKRVVDTVGAGDSFAVGVLSALLEGESIGSAASRGNLFGSLAVQVRGDMDGLPTRQELI
ncbi:MAG TPA: sugar kinase [Psychromonas sp.]